MSLSRQLVLWLQPYADSFGVPQMPTHLPMIARSLLFWTSLQLLSSRLSPKLFPKTFSRLNRKTRISWDLHFVALCHALVITPLAAHVWLKVRSDPNHPLRLDRLYGYDYETAQVHAIALGYFIWDATISILYEGPGFIAHGVVCLIAFANVYHPVFMFDGLAFLLWELSTPFLNIHWFLDKLGMTGSLLQLINAAFLLSAYVAARLTFGVYNSFNWAKFVIAPPTPHVPAIPPFIFYFYMVGNLTLNSLNFFWFRAMIRAVQKRFTAKPVQNGKLDPVKVVRGEQTVKLGVKGKDDEQFEREAGVIKSGKSE